MAREYYNIKLLQPIFNLNKPILVNRTGRDTAAMKATLRALGEGRVVGIFPEGGIHLDADSIGKAKPGTAMLALLTRVPVIPAFIERRPHTNNLWIGITRPANAQVFFGPPIDLSRYYDREHDNAALEEVTRLLMDNIARLRPTQDRGR
jgi:1-acyl-sn-glycerol-3-phosphate acyltransferase